MPGLLRLRLVRALSLARSVRAPAQNLPRVSASAAVELREPSFTRSDLDAISVRSIQLCIRARILLGLDCSRLLGSQRGLTSEATISPTKIMCVEASDAITYHVRVVVTRKQAREHVRRQDPREEALAADWGRRGTRAHAAKGAGVAPFQGACTHLARLDVKVHRADGGLGLAAAARAQGLQARAKGPRRHHRGDRRAGRLQSRALLRGARIRDPRSRSPFSCAPSPARARTSARDTRRARSRTARR
jgi:hypothetical protein